MCLTVDRRGSAIFQEAIAGPIVREKHPGTLAANSTLGHGTELVIALLLQAAVAASSR
ncbi:hypothetical protein H6F90_19925 [Trichocoleus sp. FACHB-591]|uniref:hypothetical protein n=1 Tax=Trichocoleus sp. FACHB-591 TaxID=2692872 RepID=UPI001681DF56|nr:hypothetical protein [Trichocoleus sp. FACHB-591]MBD2097372.1 hypothetical protein [Trichocoleus sp. FACHB-591]